MLHMVDNGSRRPPKLDYAPPGSAAGKRYTMLLGISATVGGYFVAVAVGLALLGGNQGPIPFLCPLWPVLAVAGILLGKSLDRQRAARGPHYSEIPTNPDDKRGDKGDRDM
jgi:hypothetical protein